MDESANLKRYIIYLIIFSIIGLFFVAVVIMTNDKSENDLLYAVDSIGVNLSISIVASILIMIFFTNRDRRARRARAALAAQKIATSIKRIMNSRPSTLTKIDKRQIHQRIEYLRDVFHNEIDKHLLQEIDNLLADNSFTHRELQNILDIIANKYGKTLYNTVKTPSTTNSKE